LEWVGFWLCNLS